ncbi:hypothetical protein NIM88_03995 [Pseudomonas sp. GBPI_506]|uniref:hypothetical protein n=1 Tax=Pseudomonas sp. GBPI_506 TaxID=1735795 RepID=UPI0020CCA0CB|nr:hypothetical protein [Pseudomonas sp. GBPI_506]MCP9731549.1 hypothetical protein [Pseudomonas sp. GBPI_506]
MSNQNNGGPAFPHVPESFVYVPGQGKANIPGTDGGMSLRDYFAAKAMQAIITGNNADHCSLGLGTAKDAYIVADAMLATRSA